MNEKDPIFLSDPVPTVPSTVLSILLHQPLNYYVLPTLEVGHSVEERCPEWRLELNESSITFPTLHFTQFPFLVLLHAFQRTYYRHHSVFVSQAFSIPFITLNFAV